MTWGCGQAMGIHRLQAGTQQPFYHVMVDERDRPGGQTTYVAQVRSDSMELAVHCHLAQPHSAVRVLIAFLWMIFWK